MHMLGHHNVAIDAQSVASANALKCSLENIVCFGRGEIFKPLITAESDKVTLPGLLDAPESPRHDGEDNSGKQVHSSKKREAKQQEAKSKKAGATKGATAEAGTTASAKAPLNEKSVEWATLRLLLKQRGR